MTDNSILGAAVKYLSENGGFEQLKDVDGVIYRSNEWQELTPLTSEEIEGIAQTHAVLLAEIEATKYQSDRAEKYPPITDYLDGVVKGDQAQIDAYIAACLAVKTKYPKPSE